MKSDIKLTIYDFIGYFIPGFITLFGIAFFCSLAVSKTYYWSISGFNVYFAFLVVLFSLVTGHFIQAIASNLTKLFKIEEEREINKFSKHKVHSWIFDYVKNYIIEEFKVEAEKLDDKAIFEIANETVLQKGVPDEREIFIYHVGFYKNCFIAMFIFTIMLILSLFLHCNSIRINNEIFIVTNLSLFLGCVSTTVCCCLCVMRYLKFMKYRVYRMFYAFLVITSNIGAK
jgi:hypothetical protein